MIHLHWILNEQTALKSERAFEQIQFIKVEPAAVGIYYAKKVPETNHERAFMTLEKRLQ